MSYRDRYKLIAADEREFDFATEDLYHTLKFSMDMVSELYRQDMIDTALFPIEIYDHEDILVAKLMDNKNWLLFT